MLPPAGRHGVGKHGAFLPEERARFDFHREAFFLISDEQVEAAVPHGDLPPQDAVVFPSGNALLIDERRRRVICPGRVEGDHHAVPLRADDAPRRAVPFLFMTLREERRPRKEKRSSRMRPGLGMWARTVSPSSSISMTNRFGRRSNRPFLISFMLFPISKRKAGQPPGRSALYPFIRYTLKRKYATSPSWIS